MDTLAEAAKALSWSKSWRQPRIAAPPDNCEPSDAPKLMVTVPAVGSQAAGFDEAAARLGLIAGDLAHVQPVGGQGDAHSVADAHGHGALLLRHALDPLIVRGLHLVALDAGQAGRVQPRAFQALGQASQAAGEAGFAGPGGQVRPSHRARLGSKRCPVAAPPS